MKYIIALLALTALNSNALVVVFEGHPLKKIETNAKASTTSIINNKDKENYKVQIVKEGESYYWKSRGNTQVVPIVSGSYLTFLAVNGSGYVRTYSKEMMELLNQLPSDKKDEEFLYVEHLAHQLGSITYYGR